MIDDPKTAARHCVLGAHRRMGFVSLGKKSPSAANKWRAVYVYPSAGQYARWLLFPKNAPEFEAILVALDAWLEKNQDRTSFPISEAVWRVKRGLAHEIPLLKGTPK